MRHIRLAHRSSFAHRPSPSLGTAKSGLIVSLILPVIVAMLVIAGTTIGVYLTASQWVSQYNYSRLLDNYPHLVQKTQSDQTEQLAVAEQYNKKLASSAQLLPNHRKPTGSKSADVISISAFGRTWTYNQILNVDGSGLIGQISIPKIDVDLPIYHGTDDATLAQGAGHLEGTSLPVGGRSTRTVITAHRGLAQAALFTRLNEVKKGDTFTLQVFGRTLAYRVITTQVVEPSDIQAVKVVPGEDLATLVTCTPLGINSHRILVTGERFIPKTASDVKRANRPSDVLKFPWWLIGYLSVIAWAIIWLIQQIQLAVRSRPSSPWSARHFSGKKMTRQPEKAR
jgi:sortase A